MGGSYNMDSITCRHTRERYSRFTSETSSTPPVGQMHPPSNYEELDESRKQTKVYLAMGQRTQRRMAIISISLSPYTAEMDRKPGNIPSICWTMSKRPISESGC